MRSICAAIVGVLLVSTCSVAPSAQLGALAGGSAVLSGRRLGGTVKARVIDGARAKRLDDMCASLWFDDDEILLVEYRGRNYLIRTQQRWQRGTRL